MPVASSQTAMMSLPSEVVEEMLVYMAEQGDSLSISRLAQTCRRFHELVYDPLDKFLWRRVFLTNFDDPRASNDETFLSASFATVLCVLDILKPDCGTGEASTFDWGEDFRARVWAQSYIRRRINEDKGDSGRSMAHRLRSKRRTLPSHDESEFFGKALHTIVRVLDTTARAMKRDVEHENPGTTLSTASLGDADDRSPTGPLPVDVDEQSKNVAWLTALTAEGFPREFNPRFSQTDKDPYWSTGSDVQAMHKIVAHIGVHFEKTWADRPSLGRTSPPKRADRCEMVSTEIYDMTPDELFLRARFLARRQVFDVSYLSRRRHWGPFLPYRGPEHDGQEQDEDFEDSDSDDSDYIPTSTRDTSDGCADEASPVAIRWGRRKTDPAPENMRADWIHLAAIRIVAQASLQEHFQWAEIRDTLLSMDSFRAGAWIPRSPAQAITEWDWAGVEGVWRSVQLVSIYRFKELTN